MKIFTRHQKLIAWVVIIATGYFFAKTIQQNWNNLENIDLKPDFWILLAILSYAVSVICTGVVWKDLLGRLSESKVKTKEAVAVQLASWLFKYIPGQAGSLLNKLAWAKSRQIDGKKVTASFAYENIFLLLASTIPTIPILFVALSSKFAEGQSLLLPLLITLPVVFLVLTPRVFTGSINTLFKVAGKQKLRPDEMLSASQNLEFFIKFLIPRVFNGAAFVFVVESLIGLDPSQYLVFASIYILAGIIGLMAVFVPSGLGVREAVIVLFASAYMPAEQAVALALVSRFYATLADILIAAIYLGLRMEARTKS